MPLGPVAGKKAAADELKYIYDRISAQWYGLRHHSRFGPELKELARRWQGGQLLNLGCGHGADFLPFKDGFELHGVDFSPRMIEMAGEYARKHGLAVKLAVADAGRLPYPDDSFDRSIAVALYHHIEGGPARLAAFRELKRVLAPGGEAFITVWNRWQPRFWLRPREVTVPWRHGGETLYRYFHLYSYGELAGVVKEAGFNIIWSRPESGYRFPLKNFSRNICLLVKK